MLGLGDCFLGFNLVPARRDENRDSKMGGGEDAVRVRLVGLSEAAKQHESNV